MPKLLSVIMGDGEGYGKTTLSEVMRTIFGAAHSYKVSRPDHLLGRFNDRLEYASFVMGEEAMFAGDPRIADQVKDAITGNTLNIEPKFKRARTVPSRIHMILTTNHSWAVPAGKWARRWFVCEMWEEKTFDADWFSSMKADLEAGGYGQFLNFLLSIDLKAWHPREVRCVPKNLRSNNCKASTR